MAILKGSVGRSLCGNESALTNWGGRGRISEIAASSIVKPVFEWRILAGVPRFKSGWRGHQQAIWESISSFRWFDRRDVLTVSGIQSIKTRKILCVLGDEFLNASNTGSQTDAI